MSTLAIHAERPHTTPILLSSDAFDERDRFDAWREELMLRVMRVDVDVPDRSHFHTRSRVLTLPNISIIERRSTPSIVRRTAELVRDGDDSLVFSLPWRKSMEARGPSDQARVGPGEAIIHSLNGMTSSRAPQGFRGVSLRIARKTALTVAPDAERRLNRAISVDRSASAILRLYLVSLVSTPGGLSPSVATSRRQAFEGTACKHLRSRRRSRSRRNTSNFNGVQSITGSALSNQDLGVQASATVDFYFMIKGPKNEQVTYHLKSSGSTSVFGGGQATALLYLEGTLLNYACSSSMTGYCAVSDHFQFDTDFSATSNTQEVLEIDLNGGTAAFGGGPFMASADPMITVDPLYANQGYSLELSPNVTQGSLASSVPEPGTWAMVLIGFAALGFAYRVRRRGPAVHRGATRWTIAFASTPVSAPY
jgi:hypothetical protein